MSEVSISPEIAMGSSHSHDRSMEVHCKCNMRASILTSRTESNPGRRFFSCHYFNPSNFSKRCDFFKWYDGEIDSRAKDLLNKIMAENKRLKAEIHCMRNKIEQIGEERDRLETNNNILKQEILRLEEKMQMRRKRFPCCMFASIVVVLGVMFVFVLGEKTNHVALN